MENYQVKHYFEWGALRLEPLQYLQVLQADLADCWIVTRESDQQSILVSKKAFQTQLKIGNIVNVT